MSHNSKITCLILFGPPSCYQSSHDFWGASLDRPCSSVSLDWMLLSCDGAQCPPGEVTAVRGWLILVSNISHMYKTTFTQTARRTLRCNEINRVIHFTWLCLMLRLVSVCNTVMLLRTKLNLQVAASSMFGHQPAGCPCCTAAYGFGSTVSKSL